MGWFSRLRGDRSAPLTAAAPAAAQPAAPPPAAASEPVSPDLTSEERWLNVQGVGDYQHVLKGRVPRRVEVELFAWDRTEQITVRLEGERIGDLPWRIVGPAHAALRARRQLGHPPVHLPAEVRRGDHVPAYLAVCVPGHDRFEEWIASVAPEGWVKPREKDEYPSFSTAKTYQESLAELFATHGEKPRGLLATIEFETRQDKKGNVHKVGIVKRDGLVVTEFAIDHPRWEPIYNDYQQGNPGRLLVKFSESAGKYRASGVYKTPQPGTADSP